MPREKMSKNDLETFKSMASDLHERACFAGNEIDEIDPADLTPAEIKEHLVALSRLVERLASSAHEFAVELQEEDEPRVETY